MKKKEVFKAELLEATRRATAELFNNNEHYYYYVLFTTPEGLCPYISAWSHEALEKYIVENMEYEPDTIKWSIADSPYYAYKSEYFEKAEDIIYEEDHIETALSEGALITRVNDVIEIMMEVIKQLDKEGLFAINQPREKICVNVELIPPDISNTERALKLNKPCDISTWLEEVAE